jgi:glycosyltransferase involved in cell wall biosynthesis
MSLRVHASSPERRIALRAARRILQAKATHLLGTSREALEAYGFTQDRFRNQRVEVVHCGFDVGLFAVDHGAANAEVCQMFGWPAESRIVIFVGRLDGIAPGRDWNHKNPEFALEAARLAMQECDIRMLVVGSGNAVRAVLENRVRSWGLSSRIRFTGQRLDVPALMAGSHVCLFPSREEGLGMVAVEAQAAGLRVLASDTVPAECVVDPSLVTFKPLSDDARSWAREIRRLSALPRVLPEKAAARAADSRFAIGRSYEALARAYRGLPAYDRP